MNLELPAISWVDISQLKPNKKNRNIHSEDQIERLAQIIKYQGWRSPIVVSKQSGEIVAGHGRLEAAKKLGLNQVPVSYQDFLSPDQEYAYLVSDNSIASWAELDFAGINQDIADLGPEFEIDLLGIRNFNIDFQEPKEKEIPELKDADFKMCPNCGVAIENG
jgi:ParB-like nuclease domain